MAHHGLQALRRLGAWAAPALAAGAMAVAATAIHAAPAEDAPTPEPELRIEMSLLPDGALQVRYTAPPTVRELTFWNPMPGAHDTWRAAMMAPADDCTELTRLTVRIKDSPACASATSATVRVQPRTLALNSGAYQPAQALGAQGEGGLLAYTGHYTVLLHGHALRWRWVPPANGYLLQAGIAHAQRQTPVVEQLVGAALVARSRVPGLDTVRRLGAHQYVWWGSRAPDPLADGSGYLVLDPRVEADQALRIRRALASDLAALQAAYGQGLDGPVGVLVAVDAAPQLRGETTAGRMMRLQLPINAAAAPAPRMERLIAHEVTHWWNAGVYSSDTLRPWLHEGHAEWAAQLLLHQAGQLSTEAVGAEVQSAIQTCLFTRGNTPAAQLAVGYPTNDDPYTCGLALMVLAQAQHRARTQDTSPPLTELASLHPRNAVLSVVSFAQWADGPPRLDAPPAGMHELVRGLDVGFASGYLARAQRLGLGTAQPPQDAAMSLNQRIQLGFQLLAKVALANCQGGFTTHVSTSGFQLPGTLSCRQVRVGSTLASVQGVPLVEQPAKAWQAATQACTQGPTLRLGYTDGVEAATDCPSAALASPLPAVLQLAPGWAKALGLQAP